MSDDWNCETCTYLNLAKDRVCAMCAHSRPKPKIDPPKLESKAAQIDPNDLKAIHGNVLSKFAASLWGTTRFADVTLTISKDSDTKTILCHKIVLSALSSVFNKMFEGKESDKKEGENEVVTQVEIKDYKFEDVQNFVKALYTGQIEVTEGNFIALSQLADRYDVPVVRSACGTFVEVKLTPEMALKYYRTSGIGVEYVARNAATIFKADTDTLFSLSPDKFRRLVESDDLALDEIDVFRYAFRWGREELKRLQIQNKDKEQEPGVEQDSKDDELKELRKILEDILPLVRFPLMTSEQLGSVVMPSRVVEADKLIAVFTHVSLPKTKQDLVKEVSGFSAKRRKAVHPKELAKRIPSYFSRIHSFMEDPFSLERKYEVFDHYDTDKDGKLTQAELRVVVYHLCEFTQRIFLQSGMGVSDTEVSKVQRLADEPALVERIADMIEGAMNISSDGYVTRSNFTDNLSRTMETAVKTVLGMSL